MWHHSISGDASHRSDVVKMAKFLDDHLKAVGVETQLINLGKHVMNGQELDLPPAILGRIGTDPRKKTVLIYGHFDVQPVSLLGFTSSMSLVPVMCYCKSDYACILPSTRNKDYLTCIPLVPA